MSIASFPGKIFRPPLPAEHVPRPELIAQLNQAEHCRLILICAPAGFGKSTLAIEYSEQRDARHPSVWLALDSQDAEGATFLRNLILGLQSLYPGLGRHALSLLQQKQRHQALALDQLVVSLMADLARCYDPASQPLLVLDDYHLIRGPQADRLCALLLDQLPNGFQLLITGRCKPDWHLARLRLNNRLLELGESQLRLTRDESRVFLQHSGLSQADPLWLRQRLLRNEGWIAGLRLLAMTAQESGQAASMAGSQPLIGEYLLEEVILRQPPEVQAFLDDIGVLDRFTAALCDQVRCSDQSAEIIHYLLQHQVFLVPLDADGQWFRFHHLFSDALRARHPQSREQRRAMQLRASDWFSQQGRIAEAVEQALAAEHPERAASLVQNLPLERLLAEQHVDTLLRWMAQLPVALQGSTAHLVMLHGWTLALACQLEEARSMLARLTHFLPQPSADAQRRLIGQALVLRGFIERSAGHLEQAALLCHQGLATLDDEDAGSRLMAMLLLADIDLCEHRLDNARHWARTALEMAQRIGEPLFEAQAMLMRARLLQVRGHIQRALKATNQQCQALQSLSYPRGLAVRARLTLYRGYLQGLLGNLPEAVQQLQQGIDEARDCRDVHVLPGYCLLATLQAQQSGGTAEAFDTLTEAERLMHLWDIPPVYYLGWGTALKSDIWITSGRMDLAEQWLPRLRQTYCMDRQAAPPPFFHALPALIERVYARLLWQRGEQVAAESILRGQLRQLQHSGEHLQVLLVMTLLARLLYRSEQGVEADKVVLAALALAAEDSILGPFLPLTQQTPPGLPDILSRAPASALRDTLLGMLPRVPRPDGRQVAVTLQGALSVRELDVLKCIAQGYSNQQISEALFISLHTVKSHARRINHKLGVERRTQAVAQAKVLGLLQ